MRMKLPLVILLALIAGCLGGSNEGAAPVSSCTPSITRGLEIKNFYAEYPVLEAGDESTFTLDLQNMGSSPVSNAKAELYNTGGFNITNGDPATKDIQPMDGPSEGYEPKEQLTWVLQAPETGLTNTLQSTIGVRINYDYTSTGQANAIYVPKDEWKVMQQQGNTLVDPAVQCSNGPLSVSVEPLNPIVTNEGGSKEFTLRVNVQNVGGGRVWSTAGLDKIDDVKVQLPSDVSVVDADACPDFNYAGTPVILTLKNPTKLTIGEKKTLSCKLMLNNAPAKRQNYPIFAQVNYRYRQESSVPLTVTTPGHTVYLKLATAPASIALGANFAVTTPIDSPMYDSACTDDFVNAKWTAIIQNDNTKAYAPSFVSVAGNCAAGFTINYNLAAADVSKMLCASPARLTVKVDYKTYPTSKTWSSPVTVTGCPA